MSDPLRHFDNLICIADFVAMSEERKEMLRQAASEIARLRLTEAERDVIAEMALVCDGREKRSLEWQLSDEAAHWRGQAATLRGVMDRMQ